MSCGAIVAASADEPARVGWRRGRRAAGARRLCQRQERFDQFGQGQVGVGVEADRDLPVQRLDRASQIEPAGADAEIRVAQDHAQEKEAVRALHQLGHGRIAGGPEIGPGQGRVGGGEQAAAHEGGDRRHVQPACQLGHPGLEPEPPHLDIDQQHRPLGRRKPRHDLGSAGRDRLGVGSRRIEDRHRCHLDRHHVARDLDIDRPCLVQSRAQDPGHLEGSRRRIVEPGLGAGDLGIDAGLGVERAPLVVEEQARAAFASARCPGDHDHRRLLGIGTGDAVDEVEGPGPVSHRRHPEPAVEARRRIGREPHRRLVRERVQRQHRRSPRSP